ncbi:hypothetical protein [Halomonas shantousis]
MLTSDPRLDVDDASGISLSSITSVSKRSDKEMAGFIATWRWDQRPNVYQPFQQVLSRHRSAASMKDEAGFFKVARSASFRGSHHTAS